MRALSGLLESGTHSVTKAGIHDQLENHASHLLISAPKYGQFDLYDPIHEQLPPLGGLASKVDLLAVSVASDSDSVSHDAEPFRIDEELPHLQRHPHSVRRLVEARARLHRSESVGEFHLMPVVAELIDDVMEDLGGTADEVGEVSYDVNVIETERSKTHRDRVKGLLQIVMELQEEHDDKPGAPEEKVIRRAVETGMSQEKAEQELQDLREKAEIYSPDGDHLHRT